MQLISDEIVVNELNMELGKVSNTKINIVPINDRMIRFGDKTTIYNVINIISPKPYYLHVLLDSRNPDPRNEIWRVYNGFFRFLNIFRDWDYAQRNFGHGMHFDKDHQYFPGLCYEYFCGHTEQALQYSNEGSSKRYRDHAAHMCRVGAIGSILLRSGLGDCPEVKEYMAKMGFSPDDIKTIWWCSSLLHDIGYLWEMVLKMLRNPDENKGFVEQMRRFILIDEYLYYLLTSDYHPGGYFNNENLLEVAEDILSKLKYKLGLKGRSWDMHEVIGPCLLWLHQHSLGINSNSKSILARNTILNEVLRIISQHHSTQNEVVSFSNDPLSFILILADEAQEWGRPLSIGSDHWACESVEIDYELSSEVLKITIDYPNPDILSLTKFKIDQFNSNKIHILSRLNSPFISSIVGQFAIT